MRMMKMMGSDHTEKDRPADTDRDTSHEMRMKHEMRRAGNYESRREMIRWWGWFGVVETCKTSC